MYCYVFSCMFGLWLLRQRVIYVGQSGVTQSISIITLTHQDQIFSRELPRREQIRHLFHALFNEPVANVALIMDARITLALYLIFDNKKHDSAEFEHHENWFKVLLSVMTGIRACGSRAQNRLCNA